MRPTRLIAYLGAVTAALALAAPSAPAAAAQGGASTPAVTVTAENSGGANQPSTVKIALTAHAEKSSAADTSCRPEDPALRCWGSLVLRLPDAGGFSVSSFTLHRVAVGSTSCGDTGDEGGCGDVALAAAVLGQPTEAQVNGIATVSDPGSLQARGVSPGSVVQLKMTLTDNGTAPFADTVQIVVNAFTAGMDKPQLLDTGVQRVQHVLIHFEGQQADTPAG